MKAWKKLEKDVARFFGGVRRVRINYSEACEDVLHDQLALECKYGKQVPKYLVPDVPVLFSVGDRSFILSPGTDLLEVDGKRVLNVGLLGLVPRKRKNATFLTKALEQAANYAPDKTPVACFKRPNMHGFVVGWELKCDNKKKTESRQP